MVKFTESNYRSYVASAGDSKLIMDAPLLGEGIQLDGYTNDEVTNAIEIYTTILKDISLRIYGSESYLLDTATYYHMARR